jgi:DNA-cytosine methyltransferase
MNVLSLFDGCSCGRAALERAGIPVTNYYAAEIDKHAMKVSGLRWPDIVQLGDVRNVRVSDLPFVPDLVIAGSPCQGFSFAGKRLNFDDPRSKLYWEFHRILQEAQAVNPNVKFMLENVRMDARSEGVISESLNIQPVLINSALVSAQNRERLYWTDIWPWEYDLVGMRFSTLQQPEDRGISFSDIVQKEGDFSKYVISQAGMARMKRKKYSSPRVLPHKTGTLNRYNNSSKLCFDAGTTLIPYGDGYRRMTPIECERSQTMCDNYTADVSETQRYCMSGNGWTIEVIAHIFGGLK